MAYTYTWDATFEASPADGDAASQGATKIRNLKNAIRERLDKDHYFAIAGTDADHGEHDQCTFREQAADPAAVANKGFLYTKDDGNGATELYFRDAAGNVIKLTGSGYLDPTAFAPCLRGYIDGLILSNNGTDADHDLNIAVGVATDSTGVYTMKLASALIKKADTTWAVGTNQGGMESGTTIGNSTTYHVFLIRRTDTGVVDILFSASPTAPTMPTNYTQFRRIGSFITDATANILAFSQWGDDFLWSAVPVVISSTTQSTTAVARALPVPTGVKVEALMNIHISVTSGIGLLYVFSPDVADAAPSSSVTPLSTVFCPDATTGVDEMSQGVIRVRTDTSAQVYTRANTALPFLHIATLGWRDLRGKDA